MKAIRINKFVKDYDEIRVSEVTKPQPKEGEVVVRVIAAGVNFVDLLYLNLRPHWARGKHQNNTHLVRPPFILGLEFSGIVVSSPPTSKYRPKDRVFGSGLGGYAEYIAVKESSLRHTPKGWSLASSAGLAATAPVSYGALILRGGLKKGETVLIHAAAGGLGLMAVQIAKAVGAHVIATGGSKEKLDVAKRFGADECVKYTTNEDWWKVILEKTEGRGVDVVFDPVGLVNKTLKCLKPMGRILLIGFAGREGDMERIAMNRVLLRQAQVIGYRFGMTDRLDPTETEKIWKGLGDMLEKELLKPTVYDREYRGLESVTTAMKDLSGRKVWGKAVILLDVEYHKPRL